MPTPVLVIMLVAILIALAWPWLPGSYHESVLVATPVIGFCTFIVMAVMFSQGENSWGYALLAWDVLFVFGYPIFYFPWAHHRHPHGGCC